MPSYNELYGSGSVGIQGGGGGGGNWYQQGGGGQGGGGNWYQQGGNGGGGSWYQQMLGMFPQIQQANQQINYGNPYGMQGNPFYQGSGDYYQGGYNQQQQQQQQQDDREREREQSIFKDENGRSYRKAGAIEGIFGNLNQATNALSNYSGWDPEQGFTPENIGRFAMGLPGMMVSSFTDIPTTLYEAATGNAVKESAVIKDDNGNDVMVLPDEKLTGTQRAADLGYAGLDLISFIPGVGPEAKAAGIIAKGMGKAAKIDSAAFKAAADYGATGLVKKAATFEDAAKKAGWTGDKLKAAAFGDTVADVGASTIFEGAQEAGQTGFEDIRYDRLNEDTFGRMAEAGTWGALGGLMMGTGMSGANYGLNKIKDNAISGPKSTKNLSEFDVTTPEQWSQISSNGAGSGVTMQANDTYLMEQARSDPRLRVPGSISVVNTSADNRLKMHEMSAGVEDWIAAYNFNDRNKQEMARELCNVRNDNNLDTQQAIDEIDTAINTNTVDGQQYDSVAAAMNAIKAKHWGDSGYRVAVHRNPGSKNRGEFYLTLRDFFDGSGVRTHALVSPLVGQDYDGDTPSLAFVTKDENGKDIFNITGYAPELILSREGQAMTDYWYSDFHGRRYNRNSFLNKLKEVFKDYKGSNSIAIKYARAMDQAVASNNNQAVMKVLDDIRKEIETKRTDPDALVDPTMVGRLPHGYTALSDAINYRDRFASMTTERIVGRQTIMGRVYAERAITAINESDEISEETKEKILGPKEERERIIYGESRSPLYRQGRLGSTSRLGEYYEDIGLALYTFTSAVNQPMRQHGQLNLTFAKRQEAYVNLTDTLESAGLDRDVIDELIRVSFRIAKATTTPLTAVEGMLDQHVLNQAYNETGLADNKIKTHEQWVAFRNAVLTAYNDSCEIAEDVSNIKTANGVVHDDSVIRQQVKENDDAAVDDVILRTFGDVPCEYILDENLLPKDYIGQPLMVIITNLAKDPAAMQYIFTQANDEQLEADLDNLVKAWGRSKRLAGAAVENQVRGIDFTDIKNRRDKNGGKIDRRDYPAVRNALNAIVELLSPRAALMLGLTDPIHFVENTDIGRKFIDGSSEERLNIFYALLTRGQFVHIIEALDGKIGSTEEEIAAAKKDARLALEQMQAVSPLKGIIATELLKNGSSVMLDGLTSINLSWKAKEQVADRLKAQYPDLDLIADMMITGTDQFAISSISKQKNRAGQSLVMYEQALHVEDNKVIEAIQNDVEVDKKISESVASSLFNSAAQCASFEIGVEALAGTVYDSIGTGKAFGDKGVNPKYSASFAEALNLWRNGGPISFLDRITSFVSGSISTEELAQNRKIVLWLLANPHERIDVFDDNGTDQNMLVDFCGDMIFAEASDNYDPDQGPTYADWIAVLKRYPQLQGLLSDNVPAHILSNGEGNAVSTKKNNLHDKLESYNRMLTTAELGAEDARVTAEIEQGIQEVGNALLMDPAYGKMLIWCLPDLGVEANATPEALMSGLRKLHRDFATSFYFNSQHRLSDTKKYDEADKQRDAYKRQLSISSFGDINDIVNQLIDRVDSGALKQEDKRNLFALANMEKNRDAAKKIIDSNFSKKFNKKTKEEREIEELTAATSGGETGVDKAKQSVVLKNYMEFKRTTTKTRQRMMEIARVWSELDHDDFTVSPKGNLIYNEMSSTIGVDEEYIDAEIESWIADHDLTDAEADEARLQAAALHEEFRTREEDEFIKQFSDTKIGLKEEDFVRIPHLIVSSLSTDKTTADINSLLETVDDIRHYIGDHNAFKDITFESIEALYDENGNLNMAKWRSMVSRVNGLIVEQAIRDLNTDWKTDINKNAYVAHQEYLTAFDRLSDIAYETLRTAKNALRPDKNLLHDDVAKIDAMRKKHYGTSGFPMPDFSNPVNQKAVTDYLNQMLGGPVPQAITRNAAMLRRIFGTGYLPVDIVGSIEPRKMTLGELREMREDRENWGDEVTRWNYVKEGTWFPQQSAYGKTWQMGSIGNLLDDEEQYPDDMEVEVFHPDDNAYGLWVSNTPAALSEKHKKSLRYNNIMSAILGESQEGLVLKLKKKYQEKLEIISDALFNTRSNRRIDLSDNTDVTSMREQLKQLLLEYRKVYTDNFVELFSKGGELEGLGYGREQARILSQGLTPGVIITLNDRKAVVPAEYLWSDDMFQDFLERKSEQFRTDQEEEPQIVIGDCKVLSVSPAQSASQINKAVDRLNREYARKGTKPNEASVRGAAYGAMTKGWEDYLDNQLSVDAVLSSIDSVQNARMSAIPVEESLTKFQQFVGISSDYNVGSRVSYVMPTGTYLTERTNSSLYSASMAATKHFFGSGKKKQKKCSYRIIKAFLPEERKATLSRSGNNWISEIVNSNGYYLNDLNVHGAAIVEDPDQIDAAIQWAKQTNSRLLISAGVRNSMTVEQLQEFNLEYRPVRTEDGNYYDINPSYPEYSEIWSHEERESGTTYVDPDDITGVYIDGVVARFYPGLGDASIVATQDMAKRYRSTGSHKYDGRSLTGGVGKVELVDSNTLELMRTELFDANGNPLDDKVWTEHGFNFQNQEYGDLSSEDIKRRILTFIDDSIQDKNFDGLNRTSAGRGRVLSIVKVTSAAGDEVYAPIIAPKNSPASYDHCYMTMDKSGNIYLGYSSDLDIFGTKKEQFFKIAIENEAFKGIVTVLDEDRYELPTYGFGGQKQKIQMAATYDTEKSRVPGRELQVFQGSMWWFAKKQGLDLFREEDGQIKQSIIDSLSRYENWETILDQLLIGEYDAWNLVATGSIELFQDAERNRVIQNVVKRNLGRMSMVDLFCNLNNDGSRRKTNVRFYMALQNLNLNDTMLFFNAIDQHLCPPGCFEEVDESQYWFNRDGLFRCSWGGNVVFLPVRWGNHPPIGDISEEMGPGGMANETNQVMAWSGLDNGVSGNFMQATMDFSSYMAGNPEFYRQQLFESMTHEHDRNNVMGMQSSNRVIDNVSMKYDSPKELLEVHRMMEVGDSFSFEKGKRRKYYDDNGDEIENPFADNLVKNAVGKLTTILGIDLSPRTIEILSVYETGHTYSRGKGMNSITVEEFAKSILRMAENVAEHGMIIVSNETTKGRISQPLIAPHLAKLLWESKAISGHEKNANQNNEGDFELFRSRMIEEQGRSRDLVKNIKHNPSKVRELLRADEYNMLQWGLRSGERLYENTYLDDLINATDWFSEALLKKAMPDFDFSAYRQLQEQTRQVIKDRRAMAAGRSHAKTVKNPKANGSDNVAYKNEDARIDSFVFSHLTDLTRMLGVLDLWLPISNILFRGAHQTMTSRLMALGRSKSPLAALSPYNVDTSIDQSIVRGQAVNDKDGFAFWTVIHDAALTSEEAEMLLSLESSGDVEAWVKQKANETPFNKFKNMVFHFASGGNALMKQQFANFINRFVGFCEADPTLRAYWLAPDASANGATRLEVMLSEPGGSAHFLKEVFSPNSISYVAGQQAMQSVRGGDIAQDHILIEIFKNVTNKHPLPEFLMTTLVSRFPRYSLNFTEEILNFVSPMSAFRYIFIDVMAKIGHERAAKSAEVGGDYVDPHYELLQRNTSLREALMVDLLHLGPTLMAMVIAALPGAVEPPDDEKKWGNPEEWLFCGARVAEVWWLEDILGIIIPTVCYQKSVQLGKPRLDLIVNGITNICYNNPMVKIGDAVSFMMDPTDGLYADYEEMRNKYADAHGGDFGFLDYLQADATTFGWSYASQFFTPTFVKSIWQAAIPYEYDYRRVYQENVRGQLTEEGAAGEKLIETDFDDAMLRRLTRKNPVLALVMDLTHPGSHTSYSPLGFPGKEPMPLTSYIDQHQYAYMKEWSIQGLSQEDQQAKVAQILYMLEYYQDDMDALISTGFYLDSGTKAAVSSAMWDRVYALDEYWNTQQAEGNFDFYLLGNGDYSAGREVYYTLKQQYIDAKKYYSDLYYKTIKSKQLSQPLVTYNRYNTTYAQDDDGNWYATGIHPMGVLPFRSAPGRISDPEGTAGYENDWVTISAVTGLPLENMRALVPSNSGEYEEWPELEKWSGDGDGTGYSAMYQKWYGNSNTTGSNTGAKTSGYPRSTGYSRSYGGGGGGYRRRRGGGGGGGGGGYTPNIYAPTVNLNRPNSSRIMNADRIQREYLDYLRPDFETKGSREAYKRSDI